MNTYEAHLGYLSIREAADLIRARKLSPVGLTAAVLDRINRLSYLNAYITVTREWAMALARAAEQEIMDGNYRGPLHGIPIGLKDLYDTAGVLTTAGSKVLADNVPREHATGVARLLEAGAVIVGKQNMHEFAAGFSVSTPTSALPLTPGIPTIWLAVRVAAPRLRLRRDSAWERWAATPQARSGSHPPSAALPALSRLTAV